MSLPPAFVFAAGQAAGEDQQKAAPLGLFVLLLLGVACYFLFKSMSRHLRRVRDDFPAAAATTRPATTRPATTRPATTRPTSTGPAAVGPGVAAREATPPAIAPTDVPGAPSGDSLGTGRGDRKPQ